MSAKPWSDDEMALHRSGGMDPESSHARWLATLAAVEQERDMWKRNFEQHRERCEVECVIGAKEGAPEMALMVKELDEARRELAWGETERAMAAQVEAERDEARRDLRDREAWLHLHEEQEAEVRALLFNDACGDALEKLWQEVIIAHKPDYGDWPYPGFAYRHLLAEFNDLRAERTALRAQVAALELRAVGAEAHLCQAVGRMELDALKVGHKDHACADCGAEKPHEGFYCIRHKAARYLDSLGLYEEDDFYPNGIETPLNAALASLTESAARHDEQVRASERDRVSGEIEASGLDRADLFAARIRALSPEAADKEVGDA